MFVVDDVISHVYIYADVMNIHGKSQQLRTVEKKLGIITWKFAFREHLICGNLCTLNSAQFAFVSDAVEHIAPNMDTGFYVKMIRYMLTM